MSQADKRMPLSEEEFISRVVKERDDGARFIPLVGSGLSKRSGILTGEEFDNYLLWSVFLVVEEGHDLSEGGWPGRPSKDQVEKAYGWVKSQTERLEEHFGEKVNGVGKKRVRRGDGKPVDGPPLALIQEAIGSLANWRSTLLFLARLTREKRDGEGARVVRWRLGAPDHRIIDEFNTFITRGKRANLGHHMLALLSVPLRIYTVLSTNFDNLLEDAFREARIPLEVFDVHTSDSLPESRVINSSHTLIKLHGSRFETRADYTLDQEPSERDKKTFTRYFCPWDSDVMTAHLLVMGYSASDHRVVSLIRHLLRRRKDRIRVFWICHCESQIGKLESLFAHEKDQGDGGREGTDDSSLSFVVGRADLILTHLYIHATKSLPPGGVAHQFLEYVAPNPVELPEGLDKGDIRDIPAKEELSRMDAFARQFCRDELKMSVGGEPGEDAREMISERSKWLRGQKQKDAVFTFRSRDDVSHLVSRIANRARESRTCLWFELEDFLSSEDFMARVYQTLAMESGTFHLEHVNLSPPHVGADRVVSYLGINPREWLLFVYGRGLPGGDCGWNSDELKRIDSMVYRGDLPGERGTSVEAYLRELAELGFGVIYLPFEVSFAKRQKKKMEQFARFIPELRGAEGDGLEDWFALERGTYEAELQMIRNALKEK